MTPDQERLSNVMANEILDQLRKATTPQECADISERYAKAFERLQAVNPVRAIHIINMAKVKKKEFENGTKTIPAKRPRRRMEPHKDQQESLFD